MTPEPDGLSDFFLSNVCYLLIILYNMSLALSVFLRCGKHLTWFLYIPIYPMNMPISFGVLIQV